jgi:tetratricopeptide (TPR) repeat protein
LAKIADDYEYKIARYYQLDLELLLFLHLRKLNDARKTLEKGESLFKIGSDTVSIHFLGYGAELLILLKDYDGAEKLLNQVNEISVKQAVVPPMILEPYLWSRLSLDMSFLEESILSNNKSNFIECRKKAYESGKNLLINAKKISIRRSGNLCLVGRYHWLIGKQNKAVKLWKRAIEEGERLGQLPDLARTYMEIGTRFLEENSKYKEIDGISAKEYLEKARTMFTKVGLQWGLDELDKIFATR